MPHRVDIDSLHKNVFVLLNIAYGAKTFAQYHDIGSDDEDDPINGRFYLGWLKSSLSEKLIDTAIKTRIVLDMIRAEEKRYEANGEKYLVNTRELDQNISDQYNIGNLTGDDEPISVRESCNKIIHALDIRPVFETGDEEHLLDEESEQKREWEYWEGALDLTGHKGKDEWHFTLYVSDFCMALEELISQLEGTVDWESLHYDEGAF